MCHVNMSIMSTCGPIGHSALEDVGHLPNWRSKASQIPAGQAGFIVAVTRWESSSAEVVWRVEAVFWGSPESVVSKIGHGI